MKPKITIATLIYANPDYLEFVLSSLDSHVNVLCDIEYLVVANDPWPTVLNYLDSDRWIKFRDSLSKPLKLVIHNNPDINAWWLDRVYSAWGVCLEHCKTPLIYFVNSDMAFCNHYLDNLLYYDMDRYVPTTRLVESERLPSLPGLISKNFGQTLSTFRKDEFEAFASSISSRVAHTNIGAFMPSLHDVNKLRSIGGWEKNINGVPGDQITFARYRNIGITPIMVCDSLAFHFQLGEKTESGDI
jgi:hypothetical protein